MKKTTKKVAKKATAKKATAKKATAKKATAKKATAKKATKKKSIVKKILNKLTRVKDYGRPDPQIEQYKPILNFDPTHEEDYIIVRISKKTLQEMLKALERKNAAEVGIPCKRR